MDRIVFELAKRSEIDEILKIQKAAFKQLFLKYQDLHTSPYNESIENILFRFNMKNSYYYFIVNENKKIGFVRIVFEKENTQARISPIAILPNYENKGYGKSAMIGIEQEFSEVQEWHLDTITQENKLINFYLKLGYQLLPKHEKVKEGMDISFYKKNVF